MSQYKKFHGRLEHNVARLWYKNKIVAFAFNKTQLEKDIIRLNLKGDIEVKDMPLYLVEMMAKEIYKKNIKQ